MQKENEPPYGRTTTQHATKAKIFRASGAQWACGNGNKASNNQEKKDF
jgi:hypothetical protein